MAEELNEWPRNVKMSRGTRSLYDWDLWLNGKVWKLVQGIDFDCKVKSMQSVVHGACRRRNMMVQTAILEDENAIMVQVISSPQKVLILPYDSDIVRRLKEEIEKNNVVDIGKGAEQHFNVSETTLTKAVEALKNQGYVVSKVRSAQKKTGKMVELTMLGKSRQAYEEAKKALGNK